MSININLLLRTDEGSLKRRKRAKILSFAAIASLVGIGLISLIIFILIQAIDTSGIRKEGDVVFGKISQFQNRQAKLFALNNRVENIDKILKTRKDLPKAVNGLLSEIPGQLSIDSFEINDTSVVITGQSRSLWAIGEFIENFTDMVRKKEIIKSLTLNSLAFSGNVYRVSVKSEL